MKIDTQKAIDQTVGPIVCRLLSWFALFRKNDKPFPPNGRILMILLSEMGSLVLAHPMIDRLREKYPRAKIYTLIFAQNREVLEMMHSIPVERIITIRNDSFRMLVSDSLKAVLNIRRARMDAAIDCELFSRVSSILSFLSGAGTRVGFHSHTQEGLYRGGYINRPVPYNPYQHISQQFITLAEAIDTNFCPAVKRRIPEKPPNMLPMPADEQAVKTFSARLQHDFPEIVGRRLVLLYAGGGLLPIRAWPLENFTTLALELIRSDFAVGVIGMRTDRALAKQVQAACGEVRCIDLTGYTETFAELVTLLRCAALLVTNDGGPCHFAPLAGTPCITLFGPETPTLYGGLGRNSVNLSAQLSCSPCLTAYNHRTSPCDGNNICLKRLSVEMVLGKGYDILNAGDRELPAK